MTSEKQHFAQNSGVTDLTMTWKNLVLVYIIALNDIQSQVHLF
jgi:hypothetical protein